MQKIVWEIKQVEIHGVIPCINITIIKHKINHIQMMKILVDTSFDGFSESTIQEARDIPLKD